MTEQDNKARLEKNNQKNGNKKNENKNHFKKKNDHKKNGNKKPQYVPPYAPELMAKSIEELRVSEQTKAILLKANIDTLGKLCSRTAKEMYGVQFFGKKQLNEVAAALKKINVDFRADETKNITVILEDKEKGIEKVKQKTSAEISKQKKSATISNDKVKTDKPQTVVVETVVETVEDNNTQKGKDKLQKQKGKTENFDIHQLFPREPFVPTPVIEAKKDEYIKYQKGSKWGFKDKNGKEIIPPIYDEVFNFKGEYACVERKQMFGFINRENELIIPYKYDWASSFSEGYACVGNESKCGYITPNDEVVIPFIYDAGTPVLGGKAQVKQNGSWGTLDILTKEVDWTN